VRYRREFLWALVSFDSKVFTAYPMDDQLIHPRELAVDLFNRASNRVRVR
jgi:hypothetical protein